MEFFSWDLYEPCIQRFFYLAVLVELTLNTLEQCQLPSMFKMSAHQTLPASGHVYSVNLGNFQLQKMLSSVNWFMVMNFV